MSIRELMSFWSVSKFPYSYCMEWNTKTPPPVGEFLLSVWIGAFFMIVQRIATDAGSLFLAGQPLSRDGHRG